MTVRQLVRVLIRRWYLLALFAVITVTVISLTPQVRGVYWTQVDVVFLPPSNFNLLQDHTDGVVQFAALIERGLNGNRDGSTPALPGGTLFGEGLSVGSTVTLLNSGSQWGNNFNRQVISIEVVDRTPEAVSQVVDTKIAAVEKLVAEQQDRADVAVKNRITTYELPAAPVIVYEQGSRVRADGAIAVLGVLIAIVSSVQFDRLLWRLQAAPVGPVR